MGWEKGCSSGEGYYRVYVEVAFSTSDPFGRSERIVFDKVAERSRRRDGQVDVDWSVRQLKLRVRVERVDNSLGEVGGQLSLFPYTSLELSTVHWKVGFEYTILGDSGTGVDRESEDIRSDRRWKPDVLDVSVLSYNATASVFAICSRPEHSRV